MVEPKSWNTKKYIFFFCQRTIEKMAVSDPSAWFYDFMFARRNLCRYCHHLCQSCRCLEAHCCESWTDRHQRFGKCQKNELRLVIYWILRNHTSLFIGGIIVQYYCIQQYVPWWESLWKSTSLHPSQDWTGCHVCVQSFISKLGQRNWWHHAQQHPQQHRNRRCFGTGYFERWWFKKCLAVSLWKFPRQHMWVQTKQMPDKKFPGWSMKSIWYWLTGKKCLGNKNGYDEHEVTVRTFCFTKTDPGKTLGNRWRGLLSKHICAKEKCVVCIAFCSLSQMCCNGITEDHLYSYLKTQTWRRVYSSNGEVQVRQERISGQEWHTRPSCLCCHRWRWWRDGSLECPSLVHFPLSPRMSRWVCQESRWHCFSLQKKTDRREGSKPHGRKCFCVHLSQEVIAVKISAYVSQQLLAELMARGSKSCFCFKMRWSFNSFTIFVYFFCVFFFRDSNLKASEVRPLKSPRLQASLSFWTASFQGGRLVSWAFWCILET